MFFDIIAEWLRFNHYLNKLFGFEYKIRAYICKFSCSNLGPKKKIETMYELCLMLSFLPQLNLKTIFLVLLLKDISTDNCLKQNA